MVDQLLGRARFASLIHPSEIIAIDATCQHPDPSGPSPTKRFLHRTAAANSGSLTIADLRFEMPWLSEGIQPLPDSYATPLPRLCRLRFQERPRSAWPGVTVSSD